MWNFDLTLVVTVIALVIGSYLSYDAGNSRHSPSWVRAWMRGFWMNIAFAIFIATMLLPAVLALMSPSLYLSCADFLFGDTWKSALFKEDGILLPTLLLLALWLLVPGVFQFWIAPAFWRDHAEQVRHERRRPAGLPYRPKFLGHR